MEEQETITTDEEAARARLIEAAHEGYNVRVQGRVDDDVVDFTHATLERTGIDYASVSLTDLDDVETGDLDASTVLVKDRFDPEQVRTDRVNELQECLEGLYEQVDQVIRLQVRAAHPQADGGIQVELET